MYLNMKNRLFRWICLIFHYCIKGNHILLCMRSSAWISGEDKW